MFYEIAFLVYIKERKHIKTLNAPRIPKRYTIVRGSFKLTVAGVRNCEKKTVTSLEKINLLTYSLHSKYIHSIGELNIYLYILKNIVELISSIRVLCVVGNPWISSHQGILTSNVESIVDLPVNIPDLPGWMIETLEDVLQHLDRS